MVRESEVAGFEHSCNCVSHRIFRMRVQIRDGLNPHTALSALDQLLIESSNVGNGTNWEQVRSGYLDRVEQATRQIEKHFSDPNAWVGLYSDWHWIIRRTDNDPRPANLLRLEMDRQMERLKAAMATITAMLEWVEKADGRPVVLDTNVLLHHLPMRQVDWPSLVTGETVRLILPIRVIEELDEKKYARRDDIAKRARSVLSELREFLSPAAGTIQLVRDGVTLELAPHNEPRERPLDADWEILTCCNALKSYASDLVLTTGDTAMAIRARTFGINILSMPEDYLRSTP